jgi:hypothetical protein
VLLLLMLLLQLLPLLLLVLRLCPSPGWMRSKLQLGILEP